MGRSDGSLYFTKLMEPGEVYSLTIDLRATGNRFKRGHRIRLDISSSSFPQFDVNPNTGAPLWSSGEVRVAHQGIYRDSRYPSRVVLPIIPKDRSPAPAGATAS